MRIITRRDTGLLTQWTFGTSGIDPDATAFIIAAGITDFTQQSAIITLVLDLKNYGIWTKMLAIYPMIGGTSTTCKFNLITPADTNAAFRLNFVGGWSFSSNGALPNGTNAYANTFIIPTTNLTLWNTHLSYYSRSNTFQAVNLEMGSYGTVVSPNDILCLVFGRTGNIAASIQNDQGVASNGANTTTATDARGFWMSNRTSNVGSTHKLWRNGASIAAATTTGGAFRVDPVLIGSVRTDTFFSNKECAFASIGLGLTDTESANYYTAVQNFQTTIGRQI